MNSTKKVSILSLFHISGCESCGDLAIGINFKIWMAMLKSPPKWLKQLKIPLLCPVCMKAYQKGLAKKIEAMERQTKKQIAIERRQYMLNYCDFCGDFDELTGVCNVYHDQPGKTTECDMQVTKCDPKNRRQNADSRSKE